MKIDSAAAAAALSAARGPTVARATMQAVADRHRLPTAAEVLAMAGHAHALEQARMRTVCAVVAKQRQDQAEHIKVAVAAVQRDRTFDRSSFRHLGVR